ncbi:unnamed protein product [Vitrella brassicaformis CCMP3155]|uniref:Uncharacterized protein n=1 Tax=Vitrella brassicaformis (strain CCMP3155) TaxID=1169540 RepID=A0A0G4EEN4_VITBC|nr:unnamed protein product [Vitrella brassicaformis CCMP3155]|eukprot:CEL94002.1 unnamed protein product [Vitrella brassicaformis CCMP3155]
MIGGHTHLRNTQRFTAAQELHTRQLTSSVTHSPTQRDYAVEGLRLAEKDSLDNKEGEEEGEENGETGSKEEGRTTDSWVVQLAEFMS